MLSFKVTLLILCLCSHEVKDEHFSSDKNKTKKTKQKKTTWCTFNFMCDLGEVTSFFPGQEFERSRPLKLPNLFQNADKNKNLTTTCHGC